MKANPSKSQKPNLGLSKSGLRLSILEENLPVKSGAAKLKSFAWAEVLKPGLPMQNHKALPIIT
jgi:hypothetical protein